MKIISQIINDISKVLQKLLIYFNGASLSTSFVPLKPVCSVIFCLNLNKALLSLLPLEKAPIAAASVKTGSSL